MTTLAVVCPPHYLDLCQLLADAGNEVHHLFPESGGDEYVSVFQAGSIDLAKAMRATAVNDVVKDEAGRLAQNMAKASLLFDAIVQRRPDGIVTTCTVDVAGQAAVLAGKFLRVPVIHVAHGCAAIAPEDAWFLRESPGDLVLVPGAREVSWWQACNPSVKTEVTGHLAWDVYSALNFRLLESGKKPTVMWIAESGANAIQTPLIWQFRDAPQRAWSAFLLAMRQIDAQIIVKTRAGENDALVQEWRNGVQRLRQGERTTFTDAPMRDVLPDASLVVCQQSNAGVEALLAGIPVVNLTRPGATLLEEVPSLSILADDLEERLASLIREGLSSSEWTAQRCKQVGSHYGHNLDGGAKQRIREAVARTVGDRLMPVARPTVPQVAKKELVLQ